MNNLITTKHVKAGSGQSAANARRGIFVQAYIANGHNATQAALTAGLSPKTAYSQGQRMLKHVETSGELAEAAERVSTFVGLTAEGVLREVARLSYSDIRKAYNSDGTIKKITEMDEDTRAAVASIEAIETKVDGVVVIKTTKIKFWDKNAALDKAMKHIGLYEKDNGRAYEPSHITIIYEDGPISPKEPGAPDQPNLLPPPAVAQRGSNDRL